MREEVKLPEMIDAAVRMSGYREKYTDFLRQTGAALRGIGLSLCFHGCGFTGSGERDLIKARVKLRHRVDGKVEILVAHFPIIPVEDHLHLSVRLEIHHLVP